MKCEMLIEEMTSMVHQWKTLKMKIGRWVHMPLTSFNTNIIHLSIAMRHRDASQHWNCICLISIKIHGVHLWSEKIGFILLIVPAARMNLVRCNNHEHNIVPCGLTAEPTIQAGFTYAGVFVVGNRGIKAEQLVVKLASDIRRIHVHGPVGHNCTKLVDNFWKTQENCLLILQCYLSLQSVGEMCWLELRSKEWLLGGASALIIAPYYVRYDWIM